MNNLGVVLKDEGRLQEALLRFDQALAIDARDAATHYNRGLTLQGLGRADDALASYKSALAIQPDFAAAHYNSGVVLCNQRQHLGAALESFDKALALEPGNEKAWTGRATALAALQRFDEALASVERGLAVNPNYAPALSTRGTILCESNRVAEGMPDFARHAELTHAQAEALQPPVAHKLRHDQEQREHLAAKGIAAPPGALYIGDGGRLAGPAINSANVESATHAWQTGKPQIAVIDNLLTDAALKKLRHFCWDSTMWRSVYPSGYLGAMPGSGFAAPRSAVDRRRVEGHFSGDFCRASAALSVGI